MKQLATNIKLIIQTECNRLEMNHDKKRYKDITMLKFAHDIAK